MMLLLYLFFFNATVTIPSKIYQWCNMAYDDMLFECYACSVFANARK